MAVNPRLYDNWDARRTFGEWYRRDEYLAAQGSANGARPNLVTIRLTFKNSMGSTKKFEFRASGAPEGDGRYRDDTHIRWEGKEVVGAEAAPDGKFIIVKRWPMPFQNDPNTKWRFDIVGGNSLGQVLGVDLVPKPRDPRPPQPPPPLSPRLNWKMAVDNYFTMYLSRSEFEPETQIASGNDWNAWYEGSAPLTGQDRLWLHIDASDDGVIAGVLGRFWITGGGYTFGNGATEVRTDVRPWVISRTGFGRDLEEPTVASPAPPSSDKATEINAKWIWTNYGLDVGTLSNHLHRYISIDIVPIAYEPPPTGVSWWEIRPIAKRGQWVRRIAWHPDVKLTYAKDIGSTRAVAIIEDKTGRRVVQNVDFGVAEFLSKDWVRA